MELLSLGNLKILLYCTLNSTKSPASAPKYPCALLIQKNDSLGELGHQ